MSNIQELRVQVAARLRGQRNLMSSMNNWRAQARRRSWARRAMSTFQTRHLCAYLVQTAFRRWVRQASRQRTREIVGRWEVLAVGATVVGTNKHALSGMLASAASVKKRTHVPSSIGRSHEANGSSSTRAAQHEGHKTGKFPVGMAALRVGLNLRRRPSSASQDSAHSTHNHEPLGKTMSLDLSSSTDFSLNAMGHSMDSDYTGTSNEHFPAAWAE